MPVLFSGNAPEEGEEDRRMIGITGEALDGYAPKREEREEEWQPSWMAKEPWDDLDDPR